MFFSIIIIVLVFVILFYLFSTNKCSANKESFVSNGSVTILMFLSSGCGHCVSYKQNMHPKVKQFAESSGYKYEVVSENDSERFSKYNIRYIPTCIILKDGKHKQLDGAVTVENIKNTINNM